MPGFKAQDAVSRSQSGPANIKVAQTGRKNPNDPKSALSTPGRDPTAVTPAISNYMPLSKLRFLELKMVSQDHKVAP